MPDGFFLCGCHPEQKRYYRQEQRGQVLSHVIKDKQGYEVCPDHGERMYGWNSLDNVLDRVGEINVKISILDSRDLRDPQQLGAEILAHRKSQQNGRSEDNLN